MNRPCAIVGYEEAIRKEARDRALAFCGLSELISGVECVMMTPSCMDWLVAMQNPYIVGGVCATASTVQFLWVLQKNFSAEKESREEFIKSILEIDYIKATVDIDGYLERTFMDAPIGTPSTPYYSATAGIVRAMAAKPFEWPFEKTIHTPVRILYQLMRAEERYKGGVLTNAISDKVSADCLNEIQTMLDNGQITKEQLEKMNNG